MYISTEEIILSSRITPIIGSFVTGENLTWYNDSTHIVHPPTVYQYAIWQKAIFACFMLPIIIFSIAGNIVVVIAISRYHYLRVTNNIFLASLAVADCAVGILAMTPNAMQLLSGHWYLKSFMCRFWFSCDVLFSTASIMHLCCVSVDRFLSISDNYAFMYKSENPWRVRIMIASVWIVSAMLSSVPIFTDLFTTTEHARRIDSLDREDGQCAFVVNMPYRFISSMVSFWVPGVLMIIFYSLVMRKAYRIEKNNWMTYKRVSRVNEENNLLNQDVNNKNTATENSRKWKREYRSIKTLGFLIGVFCLCWLAFFLRYTLCGPTHSVCPAFINDNLVLEDILFWIGYFNSALNPFLYNYTNKDFRRAFRDLARINKHKNNVNGFDRNRSNRLESSASHYSHTRKSTMN